MRIEPLIFACLARAPSWTLWPLNQKNRPALLAARLLVLLPTRVAGYHGLDIGAIIRIRQVHRLRDYMVSLGVPGSPRQ